MEEGSQGGAVSPLGKKGAQGHRGEPQNLSLASQPSCCYHTQGCEIGKRPGISARAGQRDEDRAGALEPTVGFPRSSGKERLVLVLFPSPGSQKDSWHTPKRVWGPLGPLGFQAQIWPNTDTPAWWLGHTARVGTANTLEQD